MSGPAAFVVAVALIVAAVLLTLSRQRLVSLIQPPLAGLLYRDGAFVRELPPGRHVRFDPAGRTRVLTVSLAEQPVLLPDATVLSRDQFSFRLALAPFVRVTDARAFFESQALPATAEFMASPANHPALTPILAAAILEAAGALPLAELLAAPAQVADAVQARVAGALPGMAVERVLLTGITLPPETRRLFTEVERARVEAQAALERARGEQAALRALANAARLVTGNPALGQLRLLHAIEASKGATTIVMGEPGLAPAARSPSAG